MSRSFRSFNHVHIPASAKTLPVQVSLLILSIALAATIATVTGVTSFGDALQKVSIAASAIAIMAGVIAANKAAKTRFVLDQTESVYRFHTRLLENPDLAGLVGRSQSIADLQKLTLTESSQLFQLIANRLAHLESLYLQDVGVLKPEEIDAWLGSARSVFSPEAFQRYWDADKGTYTPRFVAAMDRIIEDDNRDRSSFQIFLDDLTKVGVTSTGRSSTTVGTQEPVVSDPDGPQVSIREVYWARSQLR